MGIKRFFPWLRRSFEESITEIPTGDPLGVHIDNLGIDMNGLFHTCAQKIFKYGAYAPPPKQKRLISSTRRVQGFTSNSTTNEISPEVQYIMFYQEVCDEILRFFRATRPKRLILCVDGVAGASKMAQQRQRRFVSMRDSPPQPGKFSSVELTPGTRTELELSEYIDRWIRDQLTNNSEFEDTEVVFSDQTVHGEGEHSIIYAFKKFGKPGESYCIHGMDADLTMLTLGTMLDNVFLIRENHRDRQWSYIVNIGEVRQSLSYKMIPREYRNLCITDEEYLTRTTKDFLLLAYTIGNDFLPILPTFDMMHNVLDICIDAYKHLHFNSPRWLVDEITTDNGPEVIILHENLADILEDIGRCESALAVKASMDRNAYPNVLLTSHCDFSKETPTINFDDYRSAYYENYFPLNDAQEVCEQYLYGMRWVLQYYLHGSPDYQWYYPFHYAPFASDMADYLREIDINTSFPHNPPLSQVEQLMCVLPQQGSYLLPKSLQNFHNDPRVREYYPQDFSLDYAGKHLDYEAIVLLPMVDLQAIQEIFAEAELTAEEQYLNRSGKVKVYRRNPWRTRDFHSVYGDVLNSNAKVTEVDLVV
jgi:5'-3' exonuclease